MILLRSMKRERARKSPTCCTLSKINQPRPLMQKRNHSCSKLRTKVSFRWRGVRYSLNSVYSCLPCRNPFNGGNDENETTVPAELLDLKARLDQWLANRKYLRQPLPTELRQAVSAVRRRYSGTLLQCLRLP